MSLDLPGLDAYRAEEARLERRRVGPRVSVRCWVCGHRCRRRVYTLGRPVGMRGTVRVYGPCPVKMPWGTWCGGTLHRRDDRKRVLRAALRHERGGGNRSSEYDG